MNPVFLCLTEAGARTARPAARALGGEIHGLQSRVAQADVPFEDTAAHIRRLFRARRPVIGICAAGILIRAVAPLLGDKRVEPPLLAMSEDGGVIIPLLGGHRGANRLADRLADILGSTAAVTTASERAFGVAFDDPPPGWRLANPEDLKAFTASLLNGAGVRIEGQIPWLTGCLPKGTDLELVASERAVELGASRLQICPLTLAIGVGSARNASEESMKTLVQDALYEAGLARQAVAGVFSLDLKADEPAVLELANHLGVPLRLFDAPTLEAQTSRLRHPSVTVHQAVGCHGVAEAAALAAVGPDGELIVPKRKGLDVTCAIARARVPLVELPGRRPGRLAIVGIGPGDPQWRSDEAVRLIGEAEELVGYHLYLQLLGDLARSKPHRSFPLGAEEDRCRYALETAALGRNVALVCSGDPGIYAMGALVYELLDRAPENGGASAAARRVQVVMAPGISALQAAAARVGAPLGHDFCVISLSDLLTPWEQIERRLQAAALGDFVVALYNPVSKARRSQLARAKAILMAHRAPDTPVILASNLGRAAERIRYLRLCDLEPGDADMLTTVLIGSTSTRMFRHGAGRVVYTPRGYACAKGLT